MSVSSIQSGYHIIEQSSRMAEDAALEINNQTNAPIPLKDKSLDFNKVEFKAPVIDHIQPLAELTQAEQYSKIGTNVIQRDQDMIGTLLDIHV